MKLLLIEPSGAGGIAHYTFALANALAAKGVESILLTAKRWNMPPLPESVQIVRIFEGKKTNPIRLFQTVWRLRKQIDLVHWQTATHPWFIAMMTIGLPLGSSPWVYTVHNVMPHEEGFASKRIYRFIYRRMKHLIFHSEFSENEFHRLFPDLSPSSRIIPHGEYGFLFAQQSKEVEALLHPSVLFFGNIRRYKGLDILLRAIATVKNEIPDIRLDVVGQPLENFSEYAKLIQDLHLDEQVDLRLEYIPDGEIPEILDRAAIVALPYRRIDQSGVLLLAMASRKAVIASRVGGIQEVIRDGVNGVLIPPEDSESLAAAIVDLLLNPAKIRTMGRAAYQDSQSRFSWKRIAASTKQFYLEIIR